MKRILISLFIVLLLCSPCFGENTFYERYGVSSKGLVLWLTMDDARSYGTTQDWFDISGNKNTASQTILANQPSIVSGNFKSKVRYFDNVNYRMFAADSDSLDIDGAEITLTSWALGEDMIVNRAASTAGGDRQYGMYVTAGGAALGLDIQAAGGKKDTSKGSLSTTEFNFVAGTYDGATITWYIDGGSVGTEITSGDIVSKVSKLGIGAFADDSSSYFDGDIQSITIWNRALTAAEIKRIYDKDRNNFNK